MYKTETGIYIMHACNVLNKVKNMLLTPAFSSNTNNKKHRALKDKG